MNTGAWDSLLMSPTQKWQPGGPIILELSITFYRAELSTAKTSKSYLGDRVVVS